MAAIGTERGLAPGDVERRSLAMRMELRRLTLLANAIRGKRHRAAVALDFAWYNFCRIRSALRVTPAMEAGVTDHVWSVAAALGVAV